mmetsp:Transcript_4418/g.9068  ORF Transcript_4418/g.9068 Transcript_4418/m.9068 type:complete len:507 (-) Transcript_4418:58-1578(-)
MARVTLRALLMSGEETASNESMVHHLQQSRQLRSPECIAAFLSVDRQHFWIEGSGAVAYADMPLKEGPLHQSAPHIYATALEALMPMRKGMSFLNIGAGTGYLSALVSELIGDGAINDGVDTRPETIAHAIERCRGIGKTTISFTQGNIYEMDLNAGMRYSRVYIGACASARSKYLYNLLEVGGILVGPFELGSSQQLRRIVRETETEFRVEVLNSVHFAYLLEPSAALPAVPTASRGILSEEPALSAGNGMEHLGSALGLPGVPFTFALRPQPWTPERCWAYPASFRCAAAVILGGRPRDPYSPCLPTEIWIKHVLPWCPQWWFEVHRPEAQLPPRKLSALALMGEVMKKAFLRRSRKDSGELTPLESGPARAYSRSRTESSATTASGGSTEMLSLGDEEEEEEEEDDDDEVEESHGAAGSNAQEASLLVPDGAGTGLRAALLEAGASESAREVVPAGAARKPCRFWRCVGRCCSAAGQLRGGGGLMERCALTLRNLSSLFGGAR